MKEKILTLRKEGKTYKEIIEIVGCAKSTVSYHCSNFTKDTSKRYEKARRDRNKLWIQKLKDDLSCEICGESRSWVLDFHHKDPKNKDHGVADMVIRYSKERVLNEVKKCMVLCANCHRDIHYKEKLNRHSPFV